MISFFLYCKKYYYIVFLCFRILCVQLVTCYDCIYFVNTKTLCTITLLGYACEGKNGIPLFRTGVCLISFVSFVKR